MVPEGHAQNPDFNTTFRGRRLHLLTKRTLKEQHCIRDNWDPSAVGHFE